MKLSTEQIRSRVRQQLMALLQDDLDGGEYLMKEVWEQCDDEAHVEAAKAEISAILSFLRAPAAPRCSCTYEAGDSACVRHPTCANCGAPGMYERRIVLSAVYIRCANCGYEESAGAVVLRPED